MSIGAFFSEFSDVGYYSNNADQPECLIFRGVVFSRITSLETIDREKFWPTYPLVNSLPWRIYYERNVSSYINF